MKNKPIRHKEDNKFKFQSFAERISNVNVDVFHRVAHPNETESDDLECHFYQALEKWSVLNLTIGYDNFTKEVRGIITLPQLLHKRDHVVKVIIKYLNHKDPLYLQPLLEIVVALARDLTKEFYPYYSEFLKTLIDLLNTKDNEILEWTFHCLAYLFKFLWRYLIKDINNVFNSLLPLLSDAKPPYIQNFAAESFSFIARKVKDKPSFLKLIIETVKTRQDGISGCGKLLFDVVRGVAGYFHSCGENTLQFYFESLSNEDIPQEILFDVLQQVIINMVQNIQPRNSEIFWKAILLVIDKSVTSFQNSKSEKHSKFLDLLLKLVILTLQIKNGKFLNNPDTLIKEYMKLISTKNLPEEILLSLSKIGSLILTSKNIQLSQEHASSLIRKTLLLENKTVILDFITKLTSYSAFEPLVLPVFLKYFGQTLDPTALQVLAKIILEKSPLSQNGINLKNWKKYSLDFGVNSGKVLEHLISFVIVEDINKISRDEFIYALIILPHINATNNKEILKSLTKNIEVVHKEIKLNIDGKENLKLLLFLLGNIIECIVHITDSKNANEIFNLQNNLIPTLLDLSQNFSFTICCLKIIDIITSSCENTSLISYENLTGIDKKLLQFWSSPFHQIRLLVSHIYSQFETVPELNKNSENEQFAVFSLCHKTESIEPLIHTYRDQLHNLSKLGYDKPQGIICQKTEFSTVPLRYFLGSLYMNFQLLWEPITNLIESYAHGMNVAIFWQVFSKELKDVVLHIKENFDVSFTDLDTEVSFMCELYSKMFKVDNSPDFVNYRILLWKAMSSFSDIAEMKSKDISSLLLSFIEDEYRKNNVFEALSWNIKQTNSEVVIEEDEEPEEEDEDTKIKKKLTEAVPYAGKTNLKMLMTSLTLFSKMRNPKTLYREPELYKLYLDFLSHRNEEIQKLALDCLMVYKNKHLTPYKENLYALVDDKKFKNQLAMFRIDKETTVVQEEHRKDLIPIVLRIVHSKMVAKTGMRTGGKASSQFRRNLVLRFLAGCHEEEMMQFIHMSFRYYSKFLHDDPEILITNFINNINLEKFIPPKRLQSTLNLLQIILEQFGGLMGKDLLSYLLKILLVIGAAVLGAFQQKDLVHGGYLSALRNVRTTCQSILARFFGHFENYLWTDKELNAIFDVFIWPYLDKLTIEGIHSPTPILKLFHQWAMNPRYFVLLVKHEKNNPEQYVLPHIIKLLLTNKVHPSVSNTILEMVEKLLLLKEDEDQEGIKKIPNLEVENVKQISDNIKERLKLKEDLNYGSCILLPFVTDILEKFKKKLSNKNKGMSQRELFIMSRISELVWEPETCDIVLSLVIPMVVKKAQTSVSDETILQLVQTIFNLIKMVHEPHRHLRKIAPLFGEVTSAPTRKLLCEILEVISKKINIESLVVTYKVINELNAFNKKWLDQPDFDKRHEAFRLIDELLKTNINFELGAMIIYNCFYFIRNENDLALRESSRTCLRAIVPYLIKECQQSDKEYLFNEILFPIIRKGIKSKKENYRHKAISLLGHISRECSESHIILKDLSLFTNKLDLEVDFFENIIHLQLYRQTRALHKFNQICQDLTVPLNPRTCTYFILPLISSYLLNEKYSQKNSLIDNTIEAMKTICQFLPWHHYEGILKFYLGQLRHKIEFQKQLVKLMVAILDAYHYDLSKAQKTENSNEIQKAQIVIEASKDQSVIEESKNEDQSVTEESKTEEMEQDIDEILEELPEEEMIEEEPIKSENIPAIQRITILSPSAAKRVMFSIKTVLLPQLNKAMAEMTHYEGSHKLNRKRTGVEREEEELQKVPISLAVVKLLQKLPTYILDRNLPGVFMKTCTFLKSHLDSVRRVTRETLQKIMTTLGPKYLSSLISEMSSLLSRGFQVHVLVYTIHSILVSLKESFQPSDVDKCLLTILDVCKVDLFGALAEEKEVHKIVAKVSEAKSTKSYDTFQILAQFITEKCLMDLLLPLKEVLTHSQSYKIVNKVHECLRRIVLGLVDNEYISVESLLVFAYGTSSESIPQFITTNEKPKLTEKELEKRAREKPDCFIIPKPPVYQSGYRINKVKNNLKTNAHLLVEFGLRLCYFILKRDKIKVVDYMTYIDPFVVVFKNCLNSRHVKMSTLTINCLSWILKYDIPTLTENIKEITASIFDLLHKYASAGLSKGDNFDLVVASFKLMSILVREVKYYTVTKDQLKVLLLYAEQDLHDFDRQATAFALLKAIINRKLVTPEIHEVMDKVAKLSITSDLPHIRLQCRQVFHQFMMEYPLGKKLDKHLSFFMNQLNYELQPGRESALEMVYGFINSFPNDILKQHSGMFFVMLGARLVNDESPGCRKMVAKCLQTLLEKIDKTDRDLLFEIVLQWFKDKKINHRRLAAQVCGIIIQSEKINFTSRLPLLTPLIKSQLDPNLDDDTPGKFVRLRNQENNYVDDEEKIQPRDYQLFQLLQMLLKLCANCPKFLDQTEDIEIISQYVQTLLAYPHEWVRISAAQFIGYVLSKLEIEHLSDLLTNKKSDEIGYLYSDPENGVKSLTLDLCAQLQPGNIKPEMAEQVVKNLVFMARVLENVSMEKINPDEIKKSINLFWLTKRMRKIVNQEIVEDAKSSILRTEVFKWIAGVVTTIEADKIKKILNHLLAPLVREMSTTEENNAPLRKLAKEVAGLIRKKIGHELYISTLSSLQMQLNARRAERKRERLQLAITNPDIAAQKKIKLQEKKKIAKKRKMEGIKGKRQMKKRKIVDLEETDLFS